MIYANRDGAWRPDSGIYDYAEAIRNVMNRLYGRSVRCNKCSISEDLGWAQYRPGGRFRDGTLVFFDSAILAKAAEENPHLASERFEVMVRQSMLEWPWQSRLIVHGDAPEFVKAYASGKTHPAIEIAEKIAEHYGLPSLDLAQVAARRGRDAVQEAVCRFAETVFAPENVPEKPVPAEMPKALNADINTSCRIVSYDDGAVRRKGPWRVGVKPPVPGWMHVLEARGAGAEMEMEFRGTEIGLVDVSCSGGSVYAYSVDGGAWKTLRVADAGTLVERHTVLATGLAFSKSVSAAGDSDRHRVVLRVERPGLGCIAGFMLNGSTADEALGGGLPKTLAQMDAVYAGMDPIVWTPPARRHMCIPKTMKRLREGGELRILMLGDSLISDTCKPRNDLLLMRLYPKCKVTVVCSSRSGTGCTWYKDENRVEGWVASHRPDLLVIGGVSNGDDAEAVRSVVRQSRRLIPGLEMLLLTPVFGPEGDAKRASWNVGWDYDPDKAQNPFRRELRKVATEESCAYFDICAEQRKYCLDSGCDMGFFKRDQYHANLRGQQLIARLLEKWFSLE